MFGRKKKEKSVNKEEKRKRLAVKNVKKRDEEVEETEEKRKSIKELVAPSGINPNPLDYMIINDCGIKCFAITLYIEKFPRNAIFASTFEPLFNFKDVTTKVFINPVSPSKASKLLDKRIVILDSELVAAEKNGDRNRYRRIDQKMKDAEGWASDVEQGDNRLFETTFMFTLVDKDLDKLRLKVRDLHSKASEKGISLCGCYCVHPEAFLSTAPGVRMVNLEKGPIHSTTAKSHILDIYSLACMFNHTRSDFSHKNGIIAGRNMHTGKPVTFDIYDERNNGYGLLVAGMTNAGKSAMIKMFATRYIDLFGIHVISIDFESRGRRGEYADRKSVV